MTGASDSGRSGLLPPEPPDVSVRPPGIQLGGMVKPAELLPLDAIQPDRKNARAHSQKNLKAISDSLRHFGQVEPLVLREATRTLIGGHARWAAMRQLGWEKAWCVLLPVDAKVARALGVALNRSHDLSAFDQDMLRIAAGDLRADGWDLSELGFDVSDQRELFAGLELDDEQDDGAAGGKGGPSYQVVIECRSASEQDEVLYKLEGIDVHGKAVTKQGSR